MTTPCYRADRRPSAALETRPAGRPRTPPPLADHAREIARRLCEIDVLEHLSGEPGALARASAGVREYEAEYGYADPPVCGGWAWTTDAKGDLTRVGTKVHKTRGKTEPKP